MDAVSRRVVLLGALGLAAGGCVGEPSQSFTPLAPAPVTPSVTPTPTPTIDSRPRAPLTGKLIKDPSKLDHVAVALKVSDVRQAHPQTGLDKADIVFVEPNGVAYTRLCAVFHSTLPDLAGPVRSIRPVDVPLLSPMKPVFGNTAAADWVMNYVEHYDQFIENLYYMKVRGTGSYDIDASRVIRVNGVRTYEHAVFCHPEVLMDQAERFFAPPQQYLPFALSDGEVSTLGGKDARTVAVPYGTGSNYAMRYTYDAATKRYLRSEPWGKHVLSDGTRVSTDNLLVMRARWTMDKIYQGGGAPDPVVDIVNGKGTFYYFHEGAYVKGTWTKGEVEELFEFTLADGSPLQIAPGRTWVELPQHNAKVTIKA